jgi:hypothetical protein
MTYFCCDLRRRSAVIAHPTLNGIDFLDVSDDPSDPVSVRQLTLIVHLLKPLAPGELAAGNVRVEGGERIRNIAVTRVTIGGFSSPPASPLSSPLSLDSRVLLVEVSAAGDFSSYTLRLVQDQTHAAPPPGFDELLSAIEFSFKVNCPSDLDCQPQHFCPEELATPPEINYLAKDYASFRQLILDRMAVLVPRWRERSPADLGIALVELLAYVGDSLSYKQDAVATETYLGTARRRASVRRHVRLIDYPMHDGRNARVWVQVQASASGNGLTLRRKDSTTGRTTKLLSRIEELGSLVVIPEASDLFDKALNNRPQVFEPLYDVTLRVAHNEMRFYTWGDKRCCLPKGATRATLDGGFTGLHKDDVLVFVEKRGPETGKEEDANPGHRHAVRLVDVRVTSDLIGGQFLTPPTSAPRPVTEIIWAQADALPFPLCVSSVVDPQFFSDVGVALGNIVLADQGMTKTGSLIPDTVPEPNPAVAEVAPETANRCQKADAEPTPPRYRPRLADRSITQAASYDAAKPPPSASATLELSFEDTDEFPIPEVTLVEIDPDKPVAPASRPQWKPRRDLLDSGPTDRGFVVEAEADGTAYLRFGDGDAGLPPKSGFQFLATYRVGNGTPGNVGAGAITHVVSGDPLFVSDASDPKITRVYNPLSAAGGVDPETIEHVRQNAPSAFRRQERAVTPADYEALVVRDDVQKRCGLDVQRGAATLRWTGSWYTVFLTADRLNGQPVDDDFEQMLRSCLERYRMAGQDLEIDAPRYVSLELDLTVCVKRSYFFSHVQQALLDVLSNRTLPDGRRGLFHPDNFSFNQPVYLSAVYAAAQAVPGVDSIVITKFQRQGIDSDTAIASGRLDLGRLEIARLDNDPSFPEHGVLTLRRG